MTPQFSTTRRHATVLAAALAAALTLTAWGCGSGSDATPTLKLEPVKGKVVTEDGKPVAVLTRQDLLNFLSE